jgi:hypothetical protein
MATEADLTPERLSRMLAGHTGGAAVTAVESATVGTGQMAISLRLALTYDSSGAGPATVIAKLPSLDPASRAAAAALRCYEIEVNFYRHLQADLQVRSPAAYHTDLDVDAVDFLLLMEDVAPARQGDQIAGCTYGQAAAAVGELAGLHAPLWGHGRLEALPWLHRNTPATKGNLPELVRTLFPGFVHRYQDRLDPEVLAVARRLVAGIDTYDTVKPGPWTVTHGDFRLDNLLFADRGPDVTEVCVVDWQTAVLAPGVGDLSYFLGSAFPPADRRRHEEALVRLYHEHLGRAGVELTWGDLWSQYRRYTFGGLVMAIAASMLVQRTPRGDDMFMAMADRHGHHAVDLDAASFFET